MNARRCRERVSIDPCFDLKILSATAASPVAYIVQTSGTTSAEKKFVLATEASFIANLADFHRKVFAIHQITVKSTVNPQKM